MLIQTSVVYVDQAAVPHMHNVLGVFCLLSLHVLRFYM